MLTVSQQGRPKFSGQSMKQRLDILLREWGLAPSRAKAQELIREGAVEIFKNGQWVGAQDDALLLSTDEKSIVRLTSNEVLTYVSRGGRKLECALKDLALNVVGFRALDLGLSTGGFTDCLLKHGARFIVGVDVGHEQLAESLRTNPRLRWFDGVNARALFEDPQIRDQMAEPFDLVVIDVSFISLGPILSQAVRALKSGGYLLALIKPQFEVQADQLNKKGIVTDPKIHELVRDKVRREAQELGLAQIRDVPSRVVGQDGNQEYFLLAQKP